MLSAFFGAFFGISLSQPLRDLASELSTIESIADLLSLATGGNTISWTEKRQTYRARRSR